MSTNDRPAGFHFGPANDEDPDFSFETWVSDDSILPDLTNGSTEPTSSSIESYLSRTHQDGVLIDFFKKNQCPDRSQTLELAKHTNLNTNDVEDWFRSHRDLAAYLISDHLKQTLVRPADLVKNGWGASPMLQSNELSKDCILSVRVTHNKGDVLVDGDTSESSSRPSKKQKTLHDAQLPSISTSLATKKPKPVLQCVGDDHSCQKQFQTSDRTKLCNHENECHFPARAFRCDECSPPRWFYKPANGKSHLVNVHNFTKGPQLNQYFKCHRHYIDHMFHDTCGFEGCTETFDDRRESLTHIRNHSEQGFGRSQWTHRCRRPHRLEDHPDMCHCASDDDADGNYDDNGGDDGDDQADHDHDAPPEANDEPGEGSQGQGCSGHDAKDGSSHPDAASGSGNGGQFSFKSVSVWSTSTNASVKEEDGLDRQQPLPILGEVLGKSKSPSSNPNVIPMMSPGRMLGAGAFGAVYEVKIWPDHGHDRTSIPSVFALKRFTAAPARPSVLDTFERERTALASLKNRHPHIIQYFGSFRSEDKFNIMLGPVADMNLAQYLKTCPGYGSTPWLEAARRGHLSVAEKLLDAGAKIDTQRKRHDSALGNTGNMSTSTCDKSPLPNTGLASAVESPSGKIRGMWTVPDFHGEGEDNVLIKSMGCLASALEYLHAAPHKHGPIIHGDIKPSNILVFLGNNTCNMRLADFGSASVIAHAERTTEARTRAFTRTYQPPECKEKRLPPSRSSDIWSLGCVFSEMLVLTLYGHRYTEGVKSSESWHMRAKEWLLDLSGQEKEHSRTKAEKRLPYDIVLRMLSMKPSERPTARAVVYSLPRKCHCAEKSVNPSVPRSQPSEAVAPLPISKADVFEQKMATIGSGEDLHMPSQRSCEDVLELKLDNSIMARPEHGRITSQEMISDDVTLHAGSQPPSWCPSWYPSWSYSALRLSVGSHKFIARLDTGAEVNLISKRLCEEFDCEIMPLKDDRMRLTLANGKTLTAIGKVKLQFSFTRAPAKLLRAPFHVLEEVDAPIIGYETMMDLEVLTKRNDLVEELHSPPGSLPQCHLFARPRKLMRCIIESREVEAFPDTGSNVNLVSSEFAYRIKGARIHLKDVKKLKDKDKDKSSKKDKDGRPGGHKSKDLMLVDDEPFQSKRLFHRTGKPMDEYGAVEFSNGGLPKEIPRDRPIGARLEKDKDPVRRARDWFDSVQLADGSRAKLTGSVNLRVGAVGDSHEYAPLSYRWETFYILPDLTTDVVLGHELSFDLLLGKDFLSSIGIQHQTPPTEQTKVPVKVTPESMKHSIDEISHRSWPPDPVLENIHVKGTQRVGNVTATEGAPLGAAAGPGELSHVRSVPRPTHGSSGPMSIPRLSSRKPDFGLTRATHPLTRQASYPARLNHRSSYPAMTNIPGFQVTRETVAAMARLC